MIELKQINKSFYKGNYPQINALSNIDISFPNKGLVSIVGKSGSGKTTLINIISGFLKPSSGQIIIDGIELSSLSESEINAYRNRYFGFIFQDYNLFEKLSVFENISYVLSLQGIDDEEQKKIISRSLIKLNLDGMKDRIVETLSGGEKQRVAIARSIAKGSKVILADEPTGSLDETTAEAVLSTLKDISKEILVVMITHDRDSAQKYSDIILYLQAGKITHSDGCVSDDRMAEKFLPNKEKIDAKILFSLSNKIVFEKRKKFIFTIFFWTFSLVFMMLSLSLYFVNSNSVLENAIHENNISQMKLVKTQQLISGIVAPYNIPDEDDLLFPNLETSDYYDVGNLFPIEDFREESSPSISDFSHAFFGDFLFRSIVISDQVDSTTIPDGGVVLTDFTAQMLIDFGIIDVSSTNDAVGHILPIEGYDLTISKVLFTDYSQYYTSECDSLSNESSCEFQTDRHFLSERQNEFVTLYMNATTFDDMVSSQSDFTCIMNNHSIKIIRKGQLETITSEGMIGNMPESDSEIVVSMVFLSIVLGELVSEDNISDFIGQEILLVLNANNQQFSTSMEIVGVTYSVGSEVFVNDIVFDQIQTQLDIDIIEGFSQGTVVLLSNVDISNELLVYLQENDAFFYTSYTNELFFILDSIESFTSIAFIITAVSLVVLMTLMFFFSNNLVIQNRRQLGILLSIGMSRTDTAKLVEIQSLRMLLISFLISIPLFYLSILSMNAFLIEQTKLLSNIISYSPMPLIISLMVSLVINIIAICEPIIHFSKTELVNIIYDR